jgi:hypothetical protein
LPGLLKDQKTEGISTGIWDVGRYMYMYEVWVSDIDMTGNAELGDAGSDFASLMAVRISPR